MSAAGRATAALSLLLAGCQVGGPLLLSGEPAEQAHAAIHAAWRDYLAAQQRQDLDAVMAIYAEDAIYALVGGPPVRGRAALRAMEARGLQRGEVVAGRHVLQALQRDGDVAYELGTLEVVVRPEGEAELRGRFLFTATWQLQADGRWRLLTISGR